MKTIRRLFMIFAFLGVFGTTPPIFADKILDVVGESVNSELKTALKIQKSNGEKIENKRNQLIRELAEINSRLEAAQLELITGREQLKTMAGQRQRLEKEISTRLAGKEELESIMRDATRNLLGRAEKSPGSAEHPENIQTLKSILDEKHLLGMVELETLINICFKDMANSATRKQYTGTVLDRNGETVESEITRLGHMTALLRSGNKITYLTLSPTSGRLVVGAKPPFQVRKNLKKYLEGKTEKLFLDISGGIAISQLSRKVSWMEQLKNGGILVIPILVVGIVALFLTIERLLFLGKVRHNTDALMTKVTNLVARGDFKAALVATIPHKNRPTGRVLMAGLALKNESETVMESGLSEAILKETPRLERFLSALKVSAAVAPLLGLLGTVTGMINTFQVITVHGTGDPQLMAGGISEAMITTQVGLAVAIPIMIIAAFLSQRVQSLARDMEEKGLALMAALLKTETNAKIEI